MLFIVSHGWCVELVAVAGLVAAAYVAGVRHERRRRRCRLLALLTRSRHRRDQLARDVAQLRRDLRADRRVDPELSAA